MANFSDGDGAISNSRDSNPPPSSMATTPSTTINGSINPTTNGITSGISQSGGNLPTAAELLAHLQTLLEAKKRQLQGAATLGQRVLEQQVELQERVRQLQELNALIEDGDGDKENGVKAVKNKDGKETNDEVISGETRLRYRELVHLVEGWDEENKKDVVGAFGGINTNNGDGSSASGSHQQSLPNNSQSERPAMGNLSAASSSRRAKNAAHRADDVEFAFEIGTSLLTEVRRLQSLLGERDKAIQDMKEEKDDLDKMVEDLRERARELEGGVDKFKEENWNLEVTLQELRAQFTDSQSSLQKTESEIKRLTKQLANSRESADNFKSESERLTKQYEELKARHETDVAQARKVSAGLNREKSDLQQIVEELKKEVAKGGKGRRFGSPLTPGGLSPAGTLRTPHGGDDMDDEDLFLTSGLGVSGATGGAQSMSRKRGDGSLFPPDVLASEYNFSDNDTPDNSPSRPPGSKLGSFLAPNHPTNEIEALQQKLAHAQRQLGVLRGVVGREKEGRLKDRKRLIAAGIIDASFQWEDEIEEDDGAEDIIDNGEDEKKERGGLRGRGRGRGRARGRPIARATSGTGQRRTLAQMIVTAPEEEDSSDLAYLHDEGQKDDALDDEEYVDVKDEDFNEEEVEMERNESSVPPSPTLSSRASITADGMDPVFANVLRQSSTSSSSPLRRSIGHGSASRSTVGKRTRGRGGARGGMSTRPSSLVGEPEALAKELGLGMDSIIETEGVEPEIETEDFGCQVDLTVQTPANLAETKVIEKVLVEESIQVDPDSVIIPERTEMNIQTDPIPEPVPAPSPVLVDASVSVDLIPPPDPKPILIDSATMTEVELIDMFTPRRTTLTQEDWVQAREANLSVRSSDMTIRGGIALPTSYSLSRPTSIVQRLNEEDEDDRTEMGMDQDLETETDDIDTDIEDYQDARSVAPTPTPSESLHNIGSSNVDETDDFHSMSTLTDNDFSGGSSDEDVASIVRAQRMSRTSSRATGVIQTEMDNTIHLSPIEEKSYVDEAVEATAIVEESPTVIEIEKRKEVVECAIQTDEWLPPAPPQRTSSLLQPSPMVSGIPGFQRIGSGPTTQQFQFIHPSSQPTTATSSMSMSSGAGVASQGTSPATSIIPIPVLTPTTNVRDSAMTFGGRQTRLSTTSSIGTSRSKEDRRQSIESTLSINNAAPSSIPFGTADIVKPSTPAPGLPIPAPSSPVDKSRPPTMLLPPPPKMPPPPNSMPPPSFIPEKKKPVASVNGGDIPPPRPTSPPPPELIQRATTPIFGPALNVPGGARSIPSIRQHGSSLPPMSLSSGHCLRQPMSTNSFSSAQMSSQLSQGTAPLSPIERHLRSTTSLLSDGEEMASRRSSMSSEQFHHPPRGILDPNGRNTNISSTLGRQTTSSSGPAQQRGVQIAGGSTDPAIIHAITQTMIGEFLYKYTRKAIGKGHGEKRHKRFFWVHPYTKTLYWSSADPGSSNVSESSAKSAYIDSVRSVLDPNPMPPGLYQYSVVISTPQREMKITAPTKERHDIWLNALNYLLSRPAPMPVTATGPMNGEPRTPNPNLASPQAQRVPQTDSPWNITPRGRRSQSQLSFQGSMSKRSGTPAAEYLRWSEWDTPGSPGGANGFEHIPGGHADEDDEDLDFEIHDSILHDEGGEGYEGLENVRACCDGKHTVGRSGHDHHHHHHHHHHHPQNQPQQGRANGADMLLPEIRPSSPAWSFRSRASSVNSQDGGTGSLFSRFGSRRSARTHQTSHE